MYALDAKQTLVGLVIRGSVLVFSIVARALINTGALHSFISCTLAFTIRLTHMTRRTPLIVTYTSLREHNTPPYL